MGEGNGNLRFLILDCRLVEAVDVVPLLGVVPDAARRSLGVEAVALGSWHYLKLMPYLANRYYILQYLL